MIILLIYKNAQTIVHKRRFLAEKLVDADFFDFERALHQMGLAGGNRHENAVKRAQDQATELVH